MAADSRGSERSQHAALGCHEFQRMIQENITISIQMVLNVATKKTILGRSDTSSLSGEAKELYTRLLELRQLTLLQLTTFKHELNVFGPSAGTKSPTR